MLTTSSIDSAIVDPFQLHPTTKRNHYPRRLDTYFNSKANDCHRHKQQRVTIQRTLQYHFSHARRHHHRHQYRARKLNSVPSSISRKKDVDFHHIENRTRNLEISRLLFHKIPKSNADVVLSQPKPASLKGLSRPHMQRLRSHFSHQPSR